MAANSQDLVRWQVCGYSAHRPDRLLDLQAPLQSEAVCGLISEENLSFFARSPLYQTLHESAHLVLAFNLGAKTPDRRRQTQIRVVDIDRGELELQIGLTGHRSSGSGGHDLAGDTRPCGNHCLTADYDVLI